MADKEDEAAKKIQRFWLRLKYKKMLTYDTRREFESIAREINDTKPEWKNNFSLPIFKLPNEYETLMIQSAIASRLAILKYKK